MLANWTILVGMGKTNDTVPEKSLCHPNFRFTSVLDCFDTALIFNGE